MMIAQQSSKRPFMIRNLVRYGGHTLAVLASLDDRQIEEMAVRLKYEVVVSDTATPVVGPQE